MSYHHSTASNARGGSRHGSAQKQSVDNLAEGLDRFHVNDELLR
jgi:hypothetical protein